MREQEHTLLARVAWMYYIQGMTQHEISKKLECSRTKVTRLLAKAQESGILDIRINSAFRTCFDVEERLKARFRLREAIVVPGSDDPSTTRESVGRACAYFLEDKIVDGDILGCAWGRSLYEVGQALHPLHRQNLQVVQLMGGLNTGHQVNPQQILEVIAASLNATGVWLHVPAVVDSVTIKEALLADESVRRVLALAGRCTKALIGIGDVTLGASLITSGALRLEEMDELKAAGAVGDILGWFFDREGKPVRHEINDRVISVSLEEVARIPLRIGITAGIEKAAALLGAIRGGYLNMIVVDEITALEILRIDTQSESPTVS